MEKIEGAHRCHDDGSFTAVQQRQTRNRQQHHPCLLHHRRTLVYLIIDILDGLLRRRANPVNISRQISFTRAAPQRLRHQQLSVRAHA